MSRGWAWIDESTERSEEEMDKSRPLLDQLARQWSSLHDEEERRGFQRQADREDGYGDYDRDYDTQEEMEADKLMRREMETLRLAQHDAQLSAITDLMAKHGARMMRPYEHWNEDEAYMQYAERDRY